MTLSRCGSPAKNFHRFSSDRRKAFEDAKGRLSRFRLRLVAPAGAGKSVLLTQWAASHPELDFLWLEIVEADDERFIKADAHRMLQEADGGVLFEFEAAVNGAADVDEQAGQHLDVQYLRR